MLLLSLLTTKLFDVKTQSIQEKSFLNMFCFLKTGMVVKNYTPKGRLELYCNNKHIF